MRSFLFRVRLVGSVIVLLVIRVAKGCNIVGAVHGVHHEIVGPALGSISQGQALLPEAITQTLQLLHGDHGAVVWALGALRAYVLEVSHAAL